MATIPTTTSAECLTHEGCRDHPKRQAGEYGHQGDGEQDVGRGVDVAAFCRECLSGEGDVLRLDLEIEAHLGSTLQPSSILVLEKGNRISDERLEAIKAAIEAAAAEYESEVARMQAELETKFADYQAKAATWPDAIRQQKERELQQLDAGLQEFGMTIQNDLARLAQTQPKATRCLQTNGKTLPTGAQPASPPRKPLPSMLTVPDTHSLAHTENKKRRPGSTVT